MRIVMVNVMVEMVMRISMVRETVKKMVIRKY